MQSFVCKWSLMNNELSDVCCSVYAGFKASFHVTVTVSVTSKLKHRHHWYNVKLWLILTDTVTVKIRVNRPLAGEWKTTRSHQKLTPCFNLFLERVMNEKEEWSTRYVLASEQHSDKYDAHWDTIRVNLAFLWLQFESGTSYLHLTFVLVCNWIET